MVLFCEKACTENLFYYTCHCLWYGACLVHAAKVFTCYSIADAHYIRNRFNHKKLIYLGRVIMQVVVWKSPKALSGFLRRVFGIKKIHD